MWSELLGWLKFLVSVVKDVRQDREEREAQRQQLDNLTETVEWLLDQEQLRRRDEEQHRRDQAHEREKLLLRLKIQLLEYERRLPPSPPGAPLTPPPSLDQD